jgi:hypothetical protein
MLAMMLRMEPQDPHIRCDGCGLVLSVYAQRGIRRPAKWFLDDKAARGWRADKNADGVRRDWCPRCKEDK